jgi:heme/copper-type cytochrome/quinol oxidase subunit 2
MNLCGRLANRYNPRALQIPTPTNRLVTNFLGARRSSLFVAAAAAALFVLPQTASATPLWPDPPASPTAQVVLDLFLVVFIVGLIALIGYTLSLLGASRSAVDADAPAVAESSAKSAVIAGAVIFVVFIVIGAFAFNKTASAEKSLNAGSGLKVTTFSQPGLKVAHVVKAPAGPAYSIRVNAQQYLWRYEYTGVNNAKWNTYSYNDLVLPQGVTVLLDFTSSDAEAAWWVPQLGGSITAMPGYDNKVWIRADKSGLFPGSGTVVNGTNYANQITNVTVVDPALFKRWVAGKQIEISESMAALGAERASGEEQELISGQKSAAGTSEAASEVDQTKAADAAGDNK